MHAFSDKIAVIADDLTGAADAGVTFCPVAGPLLLCGVEALPKGGGDPCGAGIAVFTDSRNASAKEAERAVARAADYVKSSSYRMIYKKIDSTLRGNIGAETDMLVSRLGFRAGLVAPALPSQGRITLHDLHRVNGIPVAESEVSRDPLSPVRLSRLSELLASQSRFAVGHVDVELIEKGAAELSRRISSLLADGCRQIAFDAVCGEHLAAIAAVALDAFRDCLPVGSAGLAEALARAMADEKGTWAPSPMAAVAKPLFICGSASAKLAAQREELSHIPGVQSLLLEPADLATDGMKATIKAAAADISSRWREGGMVLAVNQRKSSHAGHDPGDVLRGLADLAAEVIEKASPDLVFLSGGDTAGAVFDRIGARTVWLQGEPLPGLVRGEAASGRFKGLAVVSKAGSFGSSDTLVKLYGIAMHNASAASPLRSSFAENKPVGAGE